MNRSDARLPSGRWNPEYMAQLRTNLTWLVDDDIPSIFDVFRLDRHLYNLKRRKTVGNMTFGDGGTCIGEEPGWHEQARHKKSAAQKEARQRKKERDSKLLGEPPRRRRPSRRNPRRLARSL